MRARGVKTEKESGIPAETPKAFTHGSLTFGIWLNLHPVYATTGMNVVPAACKGECC